MISFVVSPVAPNRAPLPTVDQAECLRGRGVFAVEAASPAPAPYVRWLHMHGLVAAAHLAFANHCPLVLTPDALWLCVAQGLAQHINANAEALRSRLVRHAGRLELEVRRDDFVVGDPANDWPGVFDEFSAALGEHLGGRRDLFVADFSTTDFVARAASQIALLGAVQPYISYLLGSLCGIPKIVLEGTPEDWAQMRRRAKVLREFDLGWWADALEPALERIEETSRGLVDRSFWQDFYKYESMSGGDRVTGWLNAFFPYVIERASGAEEVVRNAWFEWQARPPPAGGPDDDDEYDLELELLDRLPTLKSYPSGLASAPFTWRFLTAERAMNFVGGFFGVTQDPSGALRPRLGWAVTRARVASRCRVTGPGRSNLPELAPRGAATLDDLSWLRDEVEGIGPFALDLDGCKALPNLSALRGLSTLAELSLSGLHRLESLDGLAGLAGLKSLRLARCDALRDAGALATLTGLEHLTVMHCPALVDLSPIAELTGLTSLQLRGGAVPEALARYCHTPDEVREVQRHLRRALTG